MSTKYTLPCPGCRKKHYVQSSQAGTSIECKCGRTVTVPSMRGLAELQVVTDQPAARVRKSQDGWGVRQAIALVCMLVCGAAVAFLVYLLVTKPEDPKALAESRYALTEKQLDDRAKHMTLEDSFQLWADLVAKDIEVGIPAPVQLQKAREAFKVYQFRQTIALTVAAMSLVLALAFWFWPAIQRAPSSPAERGQA